MANRKISDLDFLTGATVADGDLIEIVDLSALAAGSKKIRHDELVIAHYLKAISKGALPLPLAADIFPVYDVAGADQKQIPFSDLQTAILAGRTIKSIQFAVIPRALIAAGYTAIPPDDTIPQITEGAQIATISVTPKSTTSKLLFLINFYQIEASNLSDGHVASLFATGTANALVSHRSGLEDTSALNQGQMNLSKIINSHGLTPLVYEVRGGLGGTNGAFEINRAIVAGVSTAVYGGTFEGNIICVEYEP